MARRWIGKKPYRAKVAHAEHVDLQIEAPVRIHAFILDGDFHVLVYRGSKATRETQKAVLALVNGRLEEDT